MRVKFPEGFSGAGSWVGVSVEEEEEEEEEGGCVCRAPMQHHRSDSCVYILLIKRFSDQNRTKAGALLARTKHVGETHQAR